MGSQGIAILNSNNRGDAGEYFVKIISTVLDELVAACPKQAEQHTKFHGQRAPAIKVVDYLTRISKYSGCSVSF
jgi:hypothetical protein